MFGKHRHKWFLIESGPGCHTFKCYGCEKRGKDPIMIVAYGRRV